MISKANNLRAIIFSLSLALGLALLIDVNKNYNSPIFWVVVATIFFIFLLELYIIFRLASAKLAQFDLPNVNRYSRALTIIYHFVVPSFFFLSLVLIVFQNPSALFSSLAMVLITIGSFIIFVNIRGYYEDKFNLELSTHFIYFLSVVLSVFALSMSLFNLINTFGLDKILSIFALGIILAAAFLFVVIESIDFSKVIIIVLPAMAIINALFGTLLFMYFDSVVRSAFLVALLFYFFASGLYNKKQGNLDFGVIVEYALVILLSLVVLYGIY